MSILLDKEEIEKLLDTLDEEVNDAVSLISIVKRFSKVANQTQLRKVAEWGNETCPHTNNRHKRECHFCWQSLLKEAGL